jgi:hypothetical protein
LGVQHERVALLQRRGAIELAKERVVVAGNVVALVDVILAVDRLRAEADVAKRESTCLLVGDEVAVREQRRSLPDHLDCLLAQPDCAVGAKSEELRLDGACLDGRERRWNLDGRAGDTVSYEDAEAPVAIRQLTQSTKIRNVSVIPSRRDSEPFSVKRSDWDWWTKWRTNNAADSEKQRIGIKINKRQ